MDSIPTWEWDTILIPGGTHAITGIVLTVSISLVSIPVSAGMIRLWATTLMVLCIRIHIGCTTTKCTIPGCTSAAISSIQAGTTGRVAEAVAEIIPVGQAVTAVPKLLPAGLQIPVFVAILTTRAQIQGPADHHRGPEIVKTAAHQETQVSTMGAEG